MLTISCILFVHLSLRYISEAAVYSRTLVSLCAIAFLNYLLLVIRAIVPGKDECCKGGYHEIAVINKYYYLLILLLY